MRLWNVQAKTSAGELRGHDGPVWHLSWSAQRRTLASAGQDGTVRLWRFASGPEGALQDSLTLRGCAGPVWWVDFSRDGTRLAAGSQDHTARLWHLDQVQSLLAARPATLITEAERETGLRVDGYEIVATQPEKQ